MMKSRLFLTNLARKGLNLFIILIFLCGCSAPVVPPLYDDIVSAITNIALNEYKIEIKVRQVGSTLWIYMPVENIFEKTDKPDKYTEKFEILNNHNEFAGSTLKLEYQIKLKKEEEKSQEYKYKKDILEKMNNLWMVLRRVLFSMDRSRQEEPKFFSIVTADIKNGIEMRETFYYLDLKKVSYGFISWGEYQHRVIQSTAIAPEAIGDKKGKYIRYQNITLDEFISGQIEHRIRLKFQKPEVDKNADIDKEIVDVAVATVKIYNFRDFSSVEFNNQVTNKRVILNKAAVWSRASD